MDITPIVGHLNERQREAVTAPMQNLMVLAGAGSGKTRVLVHRIAWLMQVENISPYNILAVTFTNKAAHEMRERIGRMLNMPVQSMWIGTFHGLAHRLLKTHWQEANLPENFQVLDSDDQLRLIKRILRAENIDENYIAPRKLQWFINAQKDEAKRPKDIHAHLHDNETRLMIELYQLYEAQCQRSGLIDFAELLLGSYELFLHNMPLLTQYQQRFQHILIDEFQDTNTIQYKWIKLLVTSSNCIMAVGDDDQSIYGWRGARIENIQRFYKDFNHPLTIRLEQNYRSTSTILNAANALISNNDGRMGKELWTSGSQGERIKVYAAFNEIDEAKFIMSQIQKAHADGYSYRSIAILYRSNAQSRVIEEALMQTQIPYRVYGGLRFFDRAEIKDALAYLKLVANPQDDTAFERVVNTPTRGIGERTMTLLREKAKARALTLWQASLAIVAEKLLPARALGCLEQFLQLIIAIKTEIEGLSLEEQTKIAIKRSGLIEHFQSEKGERAQMRLENLDELINAAGEFGQNYNREHMDEDIASFDALRTFIDHAALESSEFQSEDVLDYVQLMTLHSAKGLEFPIVYMVGMENGTFPHSMSHQEPGRIEEERRLCYVGITRAMEKLYFTHAERRRIHGKEIPLGPSLFLQEIPEELCESVRMKNRVNTFMMQDSYAYSKPYSWQPQTAGIQPGQVVNHARFGEGIVINCSGSGPDAQIQVNFSRAGTKWIIARFLEPATI